MHHATRHKVIRNSAHAAIVLCARVHDQCYLAGLFSLPRGCSKVHVKHLLLFETHATVR
jgi:hypothetical protein